MSVEEIINKFQGFMYLKESKNLAVIKKYLTKTISYIILKTTGTKKLKHFLLCPDSCKIKKKLCMTRKVQNVNNKNVRRTLKSILSTIILI